MSPPLRRRQTLHHLFPKLPRYNLRTVQSRVAKLAKKHGLVYHLYPFLDANIRTYRAMRETAKQVSRGCGRRHRRGPCADVGVPKRRHRLRRSRLRIVVHDVRMGDVFLALCCAGRKLSLVFFACLVSRVRTRFFPVSLTVC